MVYSKKEVIESNIKSLKARIELMKNRRQDEWSRAVLVHCELKLKLESIKLNNINRTSFETWENDEMLDLENKIHNSRYRLSRVEGNWKYRKF